VSVTVQEPKFKVDVNTMEHLAAKTLELNEIGVAEIATDKPSCSMPTKRIRRSAGSS
jgi:bifunctional enzyme CysN/CysC